MAQFVVLLFSATSELINMIPILWVTGLWSDILVIPYHLVWIYYSIQSRWFYSPVCSLAVILSHWQSASNFQYRVRSKSVAHLLCCVLKSAIQIKRRISYFARTYCHCMRAIRLCLAVHFFIYTKFLFEPSQMSVTLSQKCLPGFFRYTSYMNGHGQALPLRVLLGSVCRGFLILGIGYC